jgi:hypothetical protein
MGAYSRTSTSAVLRVSSIDGDDRMLCLVWCPGCDSQHPFWVQDPDKAPHLADQNVWSWDGNMDHPTFEPSLLVHPDPNATPARPRCHSFLHAGRWQFLDDSGHELAGHTVDMAPLPAWLRSEGE